MTTFGWDASHYDGELTKAILVKAKAEGIEFFSHKIGEGASNSDTTAAAALTAARDAGIKVISGYYFIHSGDMAAQAVRCIRLADQMVPWWRTFPGWFWQTDAETDTGGHLPSPAEVKAFSDRLAALSSKRVIVYASHGQYGDRLTGLGHPLWNANYPTSRKAGFRDLYPGNSYSGWDGYSGQTPAICQYTSSATIAGLTTCDANAFRGTLDELLTLITGAPAAPADPGGTMAGFDKNDLHTMLTTPAFPASAPSMTLGSAVYSAQLGVTALVASQAAQDKTLAALLAAVTALASGGTSVDTAAVLAAVHDEGAKESARVADLLARLAAAEKAHADALAAG